MRAWLALLAACACGDSGLVDAIDAGSHDSQPSGDAAADASAPDAPAPDAPRADVSVDPPVALSEVATGRRPGLQFPMGLAGRGAGFLLQYNEDYIGPGDSYFARLDGSSAMVGAPIPLAPYRATMRPACMPDGTCAVVARRDTEEYLLRLTTDDTLDPTPPVVNSLYGAGVVGAHATGFIVADNDHHARRYGPTGGQLGEIIDLEEVLGTDLIGVVYPGCTDDGCWVAGSADHVVFVHRDGGTTTAALPASLGAVTHMSCTSAACFAFTDTHVSRRIGQGAFEPPVALPDARSVKAVASDGADVVAWTVTRLNDIAAHRVPSSGPIEAARIPLVSNLGGDPLLHGACSGGLCLSAFDHLDGVDGDAATVRLMGTSVLDATPLGLTTIPANQQDQPHLACGNAGCLVGFRDRRRGGPEGRVIAYSAATGWAHPTATPVPFIPQRVVWTGARYIAFDAPGVISFRSLHAMSFDATGSPLEASPTEWLPRTEQTRTWAIACHQVCAFVWHDTAQVKLRFYAPDGTPMGAATSIGASTGLWAAGLAVAWAGDDLVVTWHEVPPDDEPHFIATRVAGDGTVETTARLASGAGVLYPSLALAALSDRLVLAYASYSDTGYLTLDAATLIATPPVFVTTNIDRGPPAVAVLGSFAVVQLLDRAYFIAPDGSEVAPSLTMTNGDVVAYSPGTVLHGAGELDVMLGVKRLALRTLRTSP